MHGMRSANILWDTGYAEATTAVPVDNRARTGNGLAPRLWPQDWRNIMTLLHIEKSLDYDYIDLGDTWSTYFQDELQEAMHSKISLCQ